ncbi:hypothetical protein AE618_10735 [Bosea vaviloviae]|uniref:Uncharacterized protein n=1 Tax=Bosea vaviloviae TaxID=1526658 RepID=A0A0N0MBL8_9HYPH|nr:hypothetical protein AE618_10735 [Bosea vaviloviae]
MRALALGDLAEARARRRDGKPSQVALIAADRQHDLAKLEAMLAKASEAQAEANWLFFPASREPRLVRMLLPQNVGETWGARARGFRVAGRALSTENSSEHAVSFGAATERPYELVNGRIGKAIPTDTPNSVSEDVRGR